MSAQCPVFFRAGNAQWYGGVLSTGWCCGVGTVHRTSLHEPRQKFQVQRPITRAAYSKHATGDLAYTAKLSKDQIGRRMPPIGAPIKCFSIRELALSAPRRLLYLANRCRNGWCFRQSIPHSRGHFVTLPSGGKIAQLVP